MNHAVICELNPLHAGHVHLFDEIKKFDEDAVIICIMSGFFVQRGDAAIFDKFTRAKTAVENGVDLVVELPFPYCMSSAQTFAQAGVDIADRLSGIDFLWFGSECGDIKAIKKTAENILKDGFRANLKEMISNERTKTYAQSFAAAYKQAYGSELILNEPNNLLGVEYVRALIEKGSKTEPKTIRRIGSAHNPARDIYNIYSSTTIRNSIIEEIELNGSAGGTNPAALRFNERWILSRIREMTENKDLSRYPYCKTIEERIYKAAQKAKDLESLFEEVKTKSITMARVRRAILGAVLGIEHVPQAPEYTSLLAADKKGTGYLNETKKTRSIEIITKPAKLTELEQTSIQAKIDLKTQRIYTTFMHELQEPGYFVRQSPYVEKE